MTSQGIKELIERLEKATGPDREIDADIHEYMWRTGYVVTDEWPDPQVRYDVPGYTSSLDAAMQLVPENYFLAELGECFGVGHWKARIAPKEPTSDKPAGFQHFYVGFNDGGKPKTPAIALTIACLKAREFQP